jgi:hypothetical protein
MNKSMIMMVLKPMLTDAAVSAMVANVVCYAKDKEAEYEGKLTINIELTQSDICLRIYKRNNYSGVPELVATHYGKELKAEHLKKLLSDGK